MDGNQQPRLPVALVAVVGTMALFGAACGTTHTDTIGAQDSAQSPPIAESGIADSIEAYVDVDETSSSDSSSSSSSDNDLVAANTDSGSTRDLDAEEDGSEANAWEAAAQAPPTVNLFTESVDDWDVSVLGPAMVGDAEFVQLIEPAAESGGGAIEESECVTGWLGLLRSDGSIYRYETLGKLGYLRLFNGPRGQDALVASCEESVERVLVQGSAVLPADGVLQFVEFPLGEPHLMAFFADFGWRGDLFGGYAWSDGWDELVYFDTGSQLITEASVLLGTREERLEHGFDFILPDGWELDAIDRELGFVSMIATDGSAWMTIETTEWAGDPEFPEGVEPLGFWTEQAPLWDYVSAGRASRAGVQDRPTWVLSTGDGTRTVQHLEGGENDLIVDFYIAENETFMLPVAQAAAEQIRVYRQATPIDVSSD